MDFEEPSPRPGDYLPRDALMIKTVIAGPFGVGKTTFVSAVSETRSLHTEERMTEAGALVDDLAGVNEKSTTTVGTDFGRLTLDPHLVLYLFGSPGQQRFRLLWEDIAKGALGVLVLVDTRRLDSAFEVMDMVEESGLPYAVAVNRFPDAPEHELDEVRRSLDLSPGTPLVSLDARSKDACLDALIALTQHVLDRSPMEVT